VARAWWNDLTKLLAVLVVLLVGALSGFFGWVVDGGIGTMDRGDLATWVSGLATAVVAFLAWTTSRKASITAEQAFFAQLAQEASNVTWSFDPRWHGLEAMNDPGVRALRHGSELPWEAPPNLTEVSGIALLEVLNGNPNNVGEAEIRLEDVPVMDLHSSGVRQLGVLRPGVSRFLAVVAEAGGSEGGWVRSGERLANNEYAFWLDFTDSKGYRWRRHANGILEPRDAELLRMRRRYAKSQGPRRRTV